MARKNPTAVWKAFVKLETLFHLHFPNVPLVNEKNSLRWKIRTKELELEWRLALTITPREEAALCGTAFQVKSYSKGQPTFLVGITTGDQTWSLMALGDVARDPKLAPLLQDMLADNRLVHPSKPGTPATLSEAEALFLAHRVVQYAKLHP
ncbi:MAG: hypothetical protein Q7R83_01880 [bacterium]|nr:hypothetical protein [bacterium]